MNTEIEVVDAAAAQALFDTLPSSLRWTTLSPAYVVADSARDSELKPLFLVDRSPAGILMHAVHESPIAGTDACDWQSAYGYGGPIAHGLDPASLASAWSRLDGVAKARGVVAEFIRFHPGLGNHRFYPGTVREDRATVAIDLRPDDLLAGYSGRARTAIRKALNGGLRAIEEPFDRALEQFPSFYRRCMSEIGATDFYRFSDDYFAGLLRLPGARVISICTESDVASMGLFLLGPSQAEYHLSGTLRTARSSGATNLLLHAAAQHARQQGCATLYLGGGTSSRPDDPLLNFKSSFAPPDLTFRIGHRIHDAPAYQRLRDAHPERAARSARVLFYRS